MKEITHFHTLSLAALLLLGLGCTEIFSPDIADATIEVQSPADSLYTAGEEIAFWWEPDSDIEQYQLRITQGAAGNVQLLLDTTFLPNSATYSFAEEGRYNWQLRGVNAGSESEWQPRSFTIDRTKPEKATAISFDLDSLPPNGSGSLRWASTDLPVDGLLLPVADTLRIYRRNDSSTLGARYYYPPAAVKSLAFDANGPAPFTGPGDYEWEVVTIDAAGNANTSRRFSFTIQ